MALVVHNLHNRKNLQKQISFICAKVPRNEVGTQNSKKKPLSHHPIGRKVRILVRNRIICHKTETPVDQRMDEVVGRDDRVTAELTLADGG